MKWMRLTMCMVAFAVVGGIAVSEDMDVRALQAKLAAQEARLNDLQAKMYGAGCDEGAVADGITTLRKNATITLGGYLNTRYFYRNGKLKSRYDLAGATGTGTAGSMQTVSKARGGDLFVADAKLEGKIDVNDYFDAYFKLDLQSSDSHSDNGEQYWVRWKNICNSGFGVLVGRDDLKYGMGPSVGILDSWSAGVDLNSQGGMFTDLFENGSLIANGGWTGAALGRGENRMMGASGSVLPMHTGWDYSRVNQITPYWENSDGTFKAELSFFQDISYNDNGWYQTTSTGHNKYRKYPNDGVGSMSGRITWKPVEGLTVIASAVNQYNKYAGDIWGDDGEKSNFAASFGFEWTPTFLCDKLTLWGYYQHGWNEGWIDDMDSDLVNAGLKFSFTESLYGFVQGDYMYVKDDNATVWHKAKGWAGYAGFGYVLPYGVNMEVGYKHEKIDYKDNGGNKHSKYKSDTIYAHLGFNF